MSELAPGPASPKAMKPFPLTTNVTPSIKSATFAFRAIFSAYLKCGLYFFRGYATVHDYKRIVYVPLWKGPSYQYHCLSKNTP